MIIGDYFVCRNMCGTPVEDCLLALHTEAVRRMGVYYNLPDVERYELVHITKVLIAALGTDLEYAGDRTCRLWGLCNTIYMEAQTFDIANSTQHTELWAATEHFYKTVK